MRLARLALGMSLALACNDDTGTGACGEVPERVMTFEPGSIDDPYGLWQRGDRVFLALNNLKRTAFTLYTAERCGDGIAEQLVGPELGLDRAYVVETGAGSLLFGVSETTGEVLRLDRLDVPGRDTPQRLAAYDDDNQLRSTAGMFGGGLLLIEQLREHGDLRPLPEPANRFNLRFYPGPDGLDAPPVMLAADLSWFGPRQGDRLYALTTAGELLRIDGPGDIEVLQTGVRALSLAPDGTQLAWQARDDAPNEPVYLRTLATGADVQIGVNDVVSSAWTPLYEFRSRGDWIWTDDALALVGPERTLVRAHARHDGALLPPPPVHLTPYGTREYNPGQDLFLLLTVDAFEEIGLAWDPVAGTVDEWYRGEFTEYGPNVSRVPDGLQYFIWGSVDPEHAELWFDRLDGAPAELLLADFSPFYDTQLLDGRILRRLHADSTAGRRLVMFDPADGSRELMARDVGTWGFNEDFTELLYTRVDDTHASVWARPL
jgi:hypothetical protein